MSADFLRVWIADDEDVIRRGVRRTLAARGDTLIVGESTSVPETISALRTNTIDLVLLDVQLHEGSGFDVVTEVHPESMPAVIFITAYDQYALQAFEAHAVDYLLKPFDEDRLNRSINRARAHVLAGHSGLLALQLRALVAARTQHWPERLSVRSGERIDLVPVELIDWIESANNYVILHCGQHQHLMTETLTGLTAKLDPARFFRIHRGRTVNVAKVVSIHPLFSGTYELELQGGLRITTGRQYRNDVLRLIAG